jgi:hypothetical protein
MKRPAYVRICIWYELRPAPRLHKGADEPQTQCREAHFDHASRTLLNFVKELPYGNVEAHRLSRNNHRPGQPIRNRDRLAHFGNVRRALPEPGGRAPEGPRTSSC